MRLDLRNMYKTLKNPFVLDFPKSLLILSYIVDRRLIIVHTIR